MKAILLNCLFSFLFTFSLSAQFIEDFDGPLPDSKYPWQTDSNRFFINDSGQLQFTSPKGKAGEDVIQVPTTYSPDMTWMFDVQLDFNPSNKNNLLIYLYSTNPESNQTIYYVQVGNNDGQISLYEWEKSKKPCISGRKGLLEQIATTVRIVVTLENNRIWTLYTCRAGEKDFTREGSHTNPLTGLREGGKLNMTFRYVKARISTFFIDRIRVYNKLTELPDISDLPLSPSTEEPEPTEPEIPSDLPELIGLEPLSNTEIQFIFSAPVDMMEATFSVSGIGDAIRKTYGATQAIVNTRFPAPLVLGNEYTIGWSGLKDMEGHSIPNDSWDVVFEAEEGDEPGEPQEPENPEPAPVLPGQIIFNEVLPNPFAGGSEYIELYNRSAKTLSLNGLTVATRKSDGSIGPRYPLASLTDSLLPGGYALLTKSASGVTAFYAILSPESVHEIKLPVLANTSSTLLLFRSEGEEMIDQLNYSSKWHTTPVKDAKGVSLERIDPDKETQDASNWISATAASGYGTPGYQNSAEEGSPVEAPSANEPVSWYEAEGKIGLRYSVDKPDYHCKAFIYDLSGRRIATLPEQILQDTVGVLLWDDSAFDDFSLPGFYLFRAELCHPESKRLVYHKLFPHIRK
ncbi:lamin tail domain-containing protein [Parabacteroides sp. Marseille-P3160]|uniref:lamin tail domain-containing protein n=1 Tax=Parabacteroides sp. Marseille-P3160 TaxID=1917887 RepID=UPI0009BA2EE7|nr:lamin tail domain-containing protein [Parabacteroides sp. Marseille-P3160]